MPDPVKPAPSAPPKQKDINSLVNWDAFDQKLAAKNVAGKAKVVNRAELIAGIKEIVQGQDESVELMAKAITNGYAKEKRTRPVAVFLLVGSPGTGKTEVAKAISKCVFGSENDMVKIDCADYKNDGEAVHKLIGVGAAYQGSSQGGTLTRPMISKPERVVLFDEIEKASRAILDVFLSMLNDGYVVEAGSNKKADFTRSIVIITSNLEHEKCAQVAETVTDHEERNGAFKALFEPHGFRPEILDRIPDVLFFKKLPPGVMGRIIVGKMRTLCQEYGIVLNQVDPDAVFHLLEEVTKNSGGVRAMVQAMERRLGDSLVEAKGEGAKAVNIIVDEENKKLLAIPA